MCNDRQSKKWPTTVPEILEQFEIPWADKSELLKMVEVSNASLLSLLNTVLPNIGDLLHCRRVQIIETIKMQIFMCSVINYKEMQAKLEKILLKLEKIEQSEMILWQITPHVLESLASNKKFNTKINYHWFEQIFENLSFTYEKWENTFLFIESWESYDWKNIYIQIPKEQSEKFFGIAKKIIRVSSYESSFFVDLWKKLIVRWDFFGVLNMNDNQWVRVNLNEIHRTNNPKNSSENFTLANEKRLDLDLDYFANEWFNPEFKEFRIPVEFNWFHWQLISFDRGFKDSKNSEIGISFAINVEKLPPKVGWSKMKNLPIELKFSSWNLSSQFKSIIETPIFCEDGTPMLKIEWKLKIKDSNRSLLLAEVVKMHSLIFDRP